MMNRFNEGERVRVTRGPDVGREGYVESDTSDGDEIRVALDAQFGRKSRSSQLFHWTMLEHVR